MQIQVSCEIRQISAGHRHIPVQRSAMTAQYERCDTLAGPMVKAPHNTADRCWRSKHQKPAPWSRAHDNAEDQKVPFVDMLMNGCSV